MKVVLSPNPYRDKGLKVVQSAEKVLRQAGVETAMCFPFEMEQDNVEIPNHLSFLPEEQAFAGADMMVCFGGDGTILHAAKDGHRHGIPVLGVNLGSVGFLSELEATELSMLERLPQRKYHIEERMMLDVAIRRENKIIYRDLALNDAVITKGAVARVVDLEVKADNVTVSRFVGDGVIVSTPTGSTAYAMSAGGPILEPTVENVLVTPICPHALHARSFVLDRSRSVTVRMGKPSRKTAYLSVDGGKAFRLNNSDQVELRCSRSKAKLIRLTNRSFYTVVNQKLGRV